MKWKCHRIKTESRKSNLDGRGFIRFVNKDDPAYKKPCGKTYTEKQLKLLSGEIAWETTPLGQLTRLLYKAETLNDAEATAKAREMRDLKIKQRDAGYTPDLTVDEAKDILRELTPWKRDN